MNALSIGDVARASGVKVPTIRFYEQTGLMPVPPRTGGGRRSYGPDDVARLRFIRHAREMGFETDDIRRLLDLSARPDASCAEVDGVARAHLAMIDNRIARLLALRDELARMVDSCAQGQISGCRVIEVLADHRHCRGAHG
jgi:DNA-binding transcriptional MerR regulator